jgi:hypothetical protein
MAQNSPLDLNIASGVEPGELDGSSQFGFATEFSQNALRKQAHARKTSKKNVSPGRNSAKSVKGQEETPNSAVLGIKVFDRIDDDAAVRAFDSVMVASGPN